MNSLIEEELPGIGEMRDQMLDLLTDADLAYKLPGYNPTLGELCEEMGQIEQVYIQSFKTFTQDWAYRDSKPEPINRVEGLRAWYKTLDAELFEVINEFSEEELHTKEIDRGYGFNPTLFVQFQIFHEALLIFYAKASVYLKALEKQLTDDWKVGIG